MKMHQCRKLIEIATGRELCYTSSTNLFGAGPSTNNEVGQVQAEGDEAEMENNTPLRAML